MPPPKPVAPKVSKASSVHHLTSLEHGFNYDPHYVKEDSLATIPKYRRNVSVHSSNYTKGNNRWNEVLLTWDKPDCNGLSTEQRAKLYQGLKSKIGIETIKIYSDHGRKPKKTLVHILAQNDNPGWDR